MNNPLTEILPANVRRYVYAVLFIAGLVLAAWQAADGDWTKFAGALVASLGFGMAGSNTPTRSQ